MSTVTVHHVTCDDCGVEQSRRGNQTWMVREGWMLRVAVLDLSGKGGSGVLDYCPPCSRKRGLHEDPDVGRGE